jgi:AcrR family transcriptional regulator
MLTISIPSQPFFLQLPYLGVPKTTLYRYFPSFKNKKKELRFRALKQALKNDQSWRKKIAARVGVSEEELAEALKKSRSAAQVKKKLASIKSTRTKRE